MYKINELEWLQYQYFDCDKDTTRIGDIGYITEDRLQ